MRRALYQLIFILFDLGEPLQKTAPSGSPTLPNPTQAGTHAWPKTLSVHPAVPAL